MLEVNNYLERRTIYNVVANIYGAVEPGMFDVHVYVYTCMLYMVCVLLYIHVHSSYMTLIILGCTRCMVECTLINVM